MSLFDVIINLIESFIGIGFIYLILQKRQKYISLLITTILCALITTFHNYYAIPELSLSLSWFISCVIYAYYLNRSHLILNLFLALFVSVLTYFSTSISMLITYFFYGFPFYQGDAYLFLAIVSKILNALFVIISVKYIHKYNILKTKKLKYILVSIFLLDILYSCVCSFVINISIFNHTIMIILISLNLLSLSLAIVFYESKKEQQNLLELQKSKLDLENQQNIITINKQNIETTKKLKHDMKHIFNALSYQIENQNISQAKEIIEDYSNILNQKIISVNTGNQLLDYILIQKNQNIINKDIDVQVEYKTSNCPLEDTDFFIIIGNLLDNAIENCQSLYQKQIIISIGYYQEYYYIKIQNSIVESILKKNPHLTTIKEDLNNHGIGIHSIKSLISKYQGKISFSDNEMLFSVKILIPLKET